MIYRPDSNLPAILLDGVYVLPIRLIVWNAQLIRDKTVAFPGNSRICVNRLSMQSRLGASHGRGFKDSTVRIRINCGYLGRNLVHRAVGLATELARL
ncbi:hypothetical protein WDZ92_13450 [Nostoc sp. NIES-2111]